MQREVLRPITISEAKKHLQAVYKDKFNFNQFSEAKSYISDSIDEVEREHTIKQRLEYAREQRQHYNSKTQVLKGNTPLSFLAVNYHYIIQNKECDITKV